MSVEIFATFGPACGQENILKEMILAGMSGMRLNLSHTTLPASKSYIQAYQKAARACGVKPQILIDMQGPELRVGKLEKSQKMEAASGMNIRPEVKISLEENDVIYLHAMGECAPFVAEENGILVVEENGMLVVEETGMLVAEETGMLAAEETGMLAAEETGMLVAEEKGLISQKEITCDFTRTKRIPVPQEVLNAAQVGDTILLDDGKIQVEVVAVLLDAGSNSTKYIAARVVRGGILRSHKSIKIQNRNVKMPVLTHHDIENIKLAKSYGVTALMQPFVLSGEDLRYVRTVLKENDAENIQIFAKIENKLGVKNLESILPEADVIIIARGDLGNDMPLWELPAVQKQIEKKCQEYSKPYIVVTQMLSSMEEHPVPTRAEVSDIFHAVYHGAWGVMITGESAIGKYPVEAVRYLANTAASAEPADKI